MMKQKINIGDYTIYGCGNFYDLIDEFDQQYNDLCDMWENEHEYFDRDELHMDLFIDYVPDFLYDDNCNQIDCKYPFAFVVKNDMSEIYYVWNTMGNNMFAYHTRKLIIVDGEYFCTIGNCIDDIYDFPNDVFCHVVNLFNEYVMHDAHLPM